MQKCQKIHILSEGHQIAIVEGFRSCKKSIGKLLSISASVNTYLLSLWAQSLAFGHTE